MKFIKYALVFAIVLSTPASLSSPQARQQSSRPPKQRSSAVPQTEGHRIVAGYGKLPLSFEVNTGQADKQVKFLSHGPGYSLFLTGHEAAIALRKASQHPAENMVERHQGRENLQERNKRKVIRMQLAGANPSPRVIAADELPGKVNYFIGNDPTKWRTNVATYAKVRYDNVYPGVDLVYYGNQGQLEYDFVVAPGADPNKIELKFRGAGKLRVDQNGDLLLGAGGGVRFQKPLVYQTVDGKRKGVEGRYVTAAADLVGFRLGEYDHTQALVIDPVLSYSTYLGGLSIDHGQAIAVDGSGNAYIAGETDSSNFPTTASAFQSTIPSGGAPAYVSKINASGSALVYSTFLGGNQSEIAYGIAVDASGNAYLTGSTYSSNFPTVNPVQATLAGPGNAFVSELNASGSALVYSTYLGGNNYTIGQAIALDASNSAYVTGYTNSNNFPTVNAIQPALGGSGATNGFVTKFSTSGSALVYSTYLGGSSSDHGNGVAVDASGNAYVTGDTNSSNFPVVNAFQPAQGASGATNAFITKFSPSGSALIYSTYLGGMGNDQGNGIAVDASGNAYVTGLTGSLNFPTANPFQPFLGGGLHHTTNGFVSKLNASGSALVYSTYLGGGGNPFGGGDFANAIVVDASGKAYITGRTASSDFPTANAVQPTLGSFNGNAFVSVFNAAGSALVYSTYLGGTGNDSGKGIAVDAAGSAYVTGDTLSSDFPTAHALQGTLGGNSDAFITKISLIASTTTTLASSLNPASAGQPVTFTATVTSAGKPNATGTVTFQEGTTVLGTGTLDTSAKATFTTSSLALGAHSIIAVYGGDAFDTQSNSAALSQDISTLQSITVSPSPGSVPAGQMLQFTATGHYADGTNGSVTNAVNWSSSNTNIATISNATGTQGLATGVNQGGPVTITALQGTISGTAQLTVTAPVTPHVLSLTPSSGTGVTQAFTVVVTDPAGSADINQVQLLFNTTLTRFGGCNVNYHADVNTIYLYADDGGPFVGGVVPGSTGQVSNGQCTLNGAGSSVSASGNNLTLTVALTFSGTWTGQKNSYVYVQGNKGNLNNGGFVLMGTWTVPAQPPAVVSFGPSSGAGLTQTFSIVVTDPSGSADLNQVQLLFNTAASRLSACNVNYHVATTTIDLYTDDGATFVGGVVPGSTQQVSNGQCTLSGAGSSISISGNSLTLNVALTFSGTFSGQKNSYVYVQGNKENLNNGGFVQQGTWTVPAQPPAVASFAPSAGAGLTQTFSIVVTDPSGLADLNQVQLLFNTTASRFSACNVNYHADVNTIYLYADDGATFVGGVTVGSAGQVSNGQCTLNGVGSSVSISGNNLTLNVALNFSGTFTGQKNSYVYVQGNKGNLNNGGFVQMGTWTP